MGIYLLTHCLAGSACPMRQSLGASPFSGEAWERAVVYSMPAKLLARCTRSMATM